MLPVEVVGFFFFFNDTATTEIYTLSLHDALPIFLDAALGEIEVYRQHALAGVASRDEGEVIKWLTVRSEEHTSELQSHLNLVCRLLLEKKKRTASAPRTDAETLATPARPPRPSS